MNGLATRGIGRMDESSGKLRVLFRHSCPFLK
jgi:hypothetical protein